MAAAAALADGDVIRSAEAPLAWCSLSWEAIAICALCGRCLGGIVGQLAALPMKGEDAGEKGGVSDEAAGVTCELGCGERYCDERCRSSGLPSIPQIPTP